ncbi:MAG: glycosyltransferase [Rhizomicrobium sp.]
MTVAPRIAWLSPYGSRSDIGAFTRCLLPHFAADAGGALDCDLFVNAYGDTYDSPVPAMEIPAAGSIGEILSRYDSVFFNLGNNAQNHTHIINALRSVAGIAVLHDFSYHHFFAHKCFEELRSPPVYARLLRDYYGSVGFNMALRSGIITREATLYAPWDGENVAQYPLTQPVSALAAAVVVHSKFMEEHVAKTFQGPILRLFLPSDQKKAPSPDEILQWGNETASRERCQFTTFGHISRAKCLDVIVQAIGSSPLLRSRGQLTIAGNASDKEYVREIEALATKLGLIKQVTFEYNVTDERLLAIKNETDVFLNLRYPNTEGASGSLIEMMNAGKPIIAYRSGCYAEVPENAALLLDRREGLDGVVAAMESLVSAPERRIAIGKAAKADLAGRDSASYVRTLKEFAADIRPQSRRRAHYVVPARDGLQWTSRDVLDEDRLWFEELTRARRTFQLLERDRYVQSPDAFLNWSIDDLTNFVGRVLLHADRPSGFGPITCELRTEAWQVVVLRACFPIAALSSAL